MRQGFCGPTPHNEILNITAGTTVARRDSHPLKHSTLSRHTLPSDLSRPGEFLPIKTTGTLRAGSRRDSCMAYTEEMLAGDSAAGRKGDPAAGSVGSDTEVQGEDCSEDSTSRDLVAEQNTPALLDADSYQRPRAGALVSLFAAMSPDPTKVHNALEDLREIVGERVLREIRTFQERVATQFQALQERVEGQLGYLQAHVDTQMTSLREHVDTQVTSLRERVEGQMTSLREYVDARVTSLQEHVDTQVTALREVVASQVTALREVMDARFDAQDARFDAHDARFDAHDARFDAQERKLDALREEINSLRRENRLLLALMVLLVTLGLIDQFSDRSTVPPSTPNTLAVPETLPEVNSGLAATPESGTSSTQAAETASPDAVSASQPDP